MFELIIDHLWQSTLIVLVAWAATRALGRYGAHWRYWIWFGASMKFLVPFVLIAQLGAQIPWPAAATEAPQNAWRTLAVRVLQPTTSLDVTAPAGETAPADVAPPPGSLAGQLLAPAAPDEAAGTSQAAGAAAEGLASAPGASWLSLSVIALGVWLLGSGLLLARWGRSWFALRALLRRAEPISIVPAEPGLRELRACSSIMEPGIFRIFKPVLLIPAGLVERLSQDQLRAIIRHESVHAARHDNLTASLHMLVEALFWFHPFVWWIGAKLVDERERACDEAVLASGIDPQVYASGLIEVCDFYVESPLLCAAGVGGGSLEGRVKRIADNERMPVLGRLGQAALIAAPVCVCLVPLALGVFQVQAVSAQQSQEQQASGLLACVDPDVLASLVLPSAVSPVISDEMPPEMAGITVPAEFEWIGSQRRDLSNIGVGFGLRGNLTAAFKTELAPEAASEAAIALLAADGWEAAAPQSFGFGGAFASAGPAQPVACLDDRSVTVNANEVDGTTYVGYGFTIGQINSACPNGRSPLGNMPGSDYAPRLELPTDPETGQPARRGGSGSSGSQSRIEIRYSGSIAELTSHMTEQLVEQGWVNDASWMGTTTAGSSWWRQADAETRVQGTLDVTETTDAAYTIMFRLVALR